MKNIYFNKGESVLRNLDEKAKPKKKINWDKIVYFVILGLLVFFIFRYSFNKLVYVTAPGHVLFKSLEVRVPEDVTLEEFFIAEGDSVKKGDTLFSYYSYEDQKDAYEQSLLGGVTINNVTESASWEEKEIYQLKKNIALNQIVISEKQQLVAYYKKEIDNITNEVILEISPKSKIDSYRKEIEQLELEIASLNLENTTFQKLINDLTLGIPKKSNGANSDIGQISGGGDGGAVLRYYFAPTNGTITRIFKSDFEVALKSENILNMHQKEDIYIKAFFSQEDLEYFKEGDEVTVIFPDGEKSVGHIKRFYFATYRMPEEFQKKYESTTRAIAADIFPIENESEIKWKAFYKMNVTVRLNKW
ncbi:MAG: efflux RND transporter periplasmic adaptor subunit [Flavobacteriales bacterium]|nr:efflux RND transporter periplasmic adaptor subunit [Flavobacteriales bacterium]